MLTIAGLPETLRQFLRELQQVNGQLGDTNRKLDQVVALLKMQTETLAELLADGSTSYTVDVPDGWLMPGAGDIVEEGE